MAITFKNPSNGHTEVVDGGASIGVFFFGALYLAYRGLWGHFLIWVLVVFGFTGITGGPGLIIALPLACIVYACCISGILEKSYLRKGWLKVSDGGSAQEIDERNCPFCAEKIKAAAIKCKHCGADVTPNATGSNRGWVATLTCLNEAERQDALEKFKKEDYPVILLQGASVSAGPFNSKDAATAASMRLRDEHQLYAAVQFRDS